MTVSAPKPAGIGAARNGAALRVSVVVPVYRNADTLRELHGRLTRAVGAHPESHELIFVNDACDAGSDEVLRDLADADESVAVIDHSTNRGQHAAVFAGLERSRGDWTVILDADLQDPPEAIPRLLAAAGPGIEAVFAGRRGKYESRTRLFTGRAYRRLLSLIAGTPADAGIFVALSRRMVTRLLEMRAALPDRSPQVVAMIGCTRLGTLSLPIVRDHRVVGGSAYSPAGRVRSAVQALAWATAWRLHGRLRSAGATGANPAGDSAGGSRRGRE